MKWIDSIYGTALYLNGKVVGWVTKGINGDWFYGTTTQTTRIKEKALTKRDAMLKLENVVGW
ncbi:MAG: hypothetical protein R3230_00205 [Nitrosopumilaceae archaeon]|nr:hypothetical protein [Nitrosopumilaceae archaeon]